MKIELNTNNEYHVIVSGECEQTVDILKAIYIYNTNNGEVIPEDSLLELIQRGYLYVNVDITIVTDHYIKTHKEDFEELLR